MSTVIHERVRECQKGVYPKLIGKVSSGWIVMGDVQFLEGYCLIYPDPVVDDLNALDSEQRKTLLYEASVVGDALLEITNAVRINYEILGNLEPALHVHIFPRFANESDALRSKPVWFYAWDKAPAFDLEKHKPLMQKIKAYLADKDLLVD